MKSISLFAVLILLAANTLHCQTTEHKIDSLLSQANYVAVLSLIRNQTNPSILIKNKEASALMSLGRLDEASVLLQNISPTDSVEKAITDNNTGYLYLLKGRSDLAQNYLEKARDIFKKQGKEKSPEAAKCLSNLSLLFWSLGKNNQAEENGLQALQTRLSIFSSESEEVAASLNDLGLIYGNTDADKGLNYYEKALAIYEKIYGGNHPKIAIANTNIGLMYLKLQLVGDAIHHFETALSIWHKIYPDGHPNEALAMANLGRSYVQIKNNLAALEYFNKALLIYKKNYGLKHPDIAAVYNQRASVLLSEKKHADALSDLQQALIANSPVFHETRITKNPPVQQFYNAEVQLYSLDLKAQTLESLYHNKTLKLKNLKLALITLQSCDSLIDLIRKGSSNENDKIALSALANAVYEDGVRIAYTISELVIQPAHYREMAFYFAEKSKSAVLQASIADAQAKSFAGISAELLEEERIKKSTITFLSEKLAAKPGEDEEQKIKNALFEIKLSYEQLIKKMEKDYPSYYNLKYRTLSATLNDIRSIIKPQQAVVSYFVATKEKRIYQFAVTATKFTVTRSTLPNNFDRLCLGFVNSLLHRDYSTYQKTEILRKSLMPHVPKYINELIILPSARLSTLPFEALPLKKVKGNSFSNTKYFINRWAISYEFAAGLMLQKEKIKPAYEASILLCAPIRFNQNKNLPDLPDSEEEVKTIAGLFPDRSMIYTYEKANEQLLKSKEASHYNILHLATHGVVDSQDPSQSEVYLNGEGAEDGNLYCGEIYNLHFNADLIVLSACETGLGKISTGEGVIGLSRALTYAGAKNIIVSFWKVADQSTAALMIDFYRQLQKNPNTDFNRSIREAKLELMKLPVYSSPYYWAPFILIGN